MQLPMTVPPTMLCRNCSQGFPLENNHLNSYFERMPTSCPNCGASFDFWEVALWMINSKSTLLQLFSLVAAYHTIIEVILEPDTLLAVDLSTYGVPENTIILDVIYSPYLEGGLFPIEYHGNSSRQRRSDRVIQLYPAHIGSESLGKTVVHIMVVWAYDSLDNDAWRSLINAFQLYFSEAYQAVIVPANVSVESSLNRLFSDFLKNFNIGNETVDKFLEEGATYSYQLNVLLPLLTSLAGISYLPDHIRGLLNRLRSLRNDMAHRAKTKKPISQNDVAELLCAALMAFHYVNYIKPKLFSVLLQSRRP